MKKVFRKNLLQNTLVYIVVIIPVSKTTFKKLTPEQIILFCEFCDISSDYLLGIKSANQKVVSLTDLDEINQKLKEIDELLNN